MPSTSSLATHTDKNTATLPGVAAKTSEVIASVFAAEATKPLVPLS